MNKLITEEEIIAIENKVEALRLRIKSSPVNLTHLSKEANEWIRDDIFSLTAGFQALSEEDQYSVMYTLYSLEGIQNVYDITRNRIHTIEVICCALGATTNSEIVKIATQLYKLSKEFKLSHEEEIQIAIKVMNHETKTMPKKLGLLALTSEISKIKRKHKKISKKEKKLCSQYTNIYKIYQNHQKIYTAIINLLYKYNEIELKNMLITKTTTTSVRPAWRKELHNFILNNEKEFLNLLQSCEIYLPIDQKESTKRK